MLKGNFKLFNANNDWLTFCETSAGVSARTL